ncbi:hypothetical protein E4U21_000324 [Claviceps maximensis]|nr:hypothetical protein E4U21_000324 [Claviceps maximensis]
MASPIRIRDPFLELPSILSPRPDRCRRHDEVLLSGRPAISIPKLGSHHDLPPPPLLIPRHASNQATPVRREGTKKEFRANSHSALQSSSSVSGSMYSSFNNVDRPRLNRRGTASSLNNGEEAYANYTVAERFQQPRPMEVFHPSQLPFQSAADLHGYSMKKKLDTVCTLDSSPRSMTSPALRDYAQQSDTRAATLNLPLRLSICNSHSVADSPAGLSVDTPIFSAVSPGSAPSPHFPQQRVRREGRDMDFSPQTRGRRNNSDDASSAYRGYEFTHARGMGTDESMSPRRPHTDDIYSAVGRKRRASSPLAEGHSRGSPKSLFHVLPQPTSASSMTSAAISRSNSNMSTYATTPTSYGRRSSGASLGGISPICSNSPYTMPGSVNQSPCFNSSYTMPTMPVSVNQSPCSNSPYTMPTMPVSVKQSPRKTVRPNAQGVNMSATSPTKLTDMQKPSGSKAPLIYMCSCCLKKPKKFDTAEQLSAHEAEKQYQCIFCGNRFKNKNEAERHQNSLHVRRHSWSCSTLLDYDHAFHNSIHRPGEADTCGYCGNDFLRTGRVPGSVVLSGSVVPNYISDRDWDERIRHLQEVHKFRECNSAKRFFRADHFRQHLKHSHAGTSGKWTNILEHACMRDEKAAKPQ